MSTKLIRKNEMVSENRLPWTSVSDMTSVPGAGSLTREITNLLSEYEPEAAALLRGSPDYPGLSGTVLFYPLWEGTMLLVNVNGLPDSSRACSSNIYAFHIHNGNQCTGTPENPFANAGTHYNPTDCPHPAHAGDLPVLLSNHGLALQMVYTDRFAPQDVIGLTAIVHANVDDYHTQPSGNPGMMIACGEIRRI